MIRPVLVTEHGHTLAESGKVQISLKGIRRVYPGRPGHPSVHALGPLDLDIRQGEFFSVVGPSGCGKSTLLDVLTGLAVPSEGTVTFEGEPVRGSVPPGIGVVFQDDASFGWLSVWDNVAFGLARSRVAKAEITERVTQALELVGLSGFAKAFPAELSGGMRQRVCIARTLVMNPKLVVLDEPFGALDQQTRLLMGDELLRLWRQTAATVVLITHSLDEANLLSDRIGVMSARPGRFIEIIETGWPKDRDSALAENPQFGAVTARLWSLLRKESQQAMGRLSEPGA